MQCALRQENSPAEGANQAFPHSYGVPKTLGYVTLRAQDLDDKGSLDASSSRSDGLRDMARWTAGGAERASDLRRKPQAYGCYKEEATLFLSASRCP